MDSQTAAPESEAGGTHLLDFKNPQVIAPYLSSPEESIMSNWNNTFIQ
jgi:hypothetical protein